MEISQKYENYFNENQYQEARRKSELNFNNKFPQRRDTKYVCQSPEFRSIGRRVTFQGLKESPYKIERIRNCKNNRCFSCSR